MPSAMPPMPPPDVHVTYSRQYRRCGKPACPRCAAGGTGHGPYWFAYWREGGRLRSRYLGKQAPIGASPPPGQTDVSPPSRQVEERHRDIAPPSPAPAPPGARPALRVRTLGGFMVWQGDRPIPASQWTRRAATALFTSLLSVSGYRLHREQVGEFLWPDAEPAAAARTLHATLHLLRGVLDGPGAAGAAGATTSALRLAGEMIVLEPGGGAPPAADWLDAAAFERAARAALAGVDRPACRAALALYGGDYLPDEPYAEWVAPRRDELRAHYQALLLHLAQLSAAADDLADAEHCLRAVLAVDACHEETAAELMGVLSAQGRRTAALRVYQALATALEADLDLAPNGAIEALRARLVAQEAAPHAADRPPHTPSTTATTATPATPTNLPVPLSGFVGRAWERSEIAGMVADTRLLTLTGPGGCGKTRLALEVAGALAGSYPDGVWHVELAALRDATLLAGVVAVALGVRERADRPVRDTVRDFLRPRETLLLLDNCEHLIDGCATLATDLLHACPGVRILATSREALRIAGETIWRVPGLAVPPADVRPEPALLLRFEAVQLLCARARASRPDFALTTANASAVMQICRRLDGLPLAIELAAARLATLAVDAVAARLDDCFGLLTGGSRTALPRQQTLRATMEWSYGLLSAGEQRLLRRLSVYAGGCAVEAVAAVCAAEGTLAGAAPDLLDGLVGKSLVGLEDADGAGRYRLLETVRQYGWERLEEAGEAAAAGRTHAAYYLALAEEAEPALTGPDQGRWLQRLDREYDNLRAALRRSRDGGEWEIGLRLAAALWRFWYVRGRGSEGQQWLEDLLAVRGGGDSARAPTPARARALYGASVLAAEQGDYRRAEALSAENLTLFAQLDDTLGRARALNLRATVARYQGDHARAAALYEESLALFRALGHAQATAVALNNLGAMAVDQGAYARAVTLNEESLAIKRGLRDVRGIARSLLNLGEVARYQGDHDRAGLLFEESLALSRELEDRPGVALALNNLGDVARTRGDDERATELYTESVQLFRDAGDRHFTALALSNLGQVAHDRGDDGRAAALYRESLTLYRDVGEKLGLAGCLEGVAMVAQAQGRAERAALLHGASAGLRAALGAPLPPSDRAAHDRVATALRETLGERAFATAWAAGRALSLEQAIAAALTPPTIAAACGAQVEPPVHRAAQAGLSLPSVAWDERGRSPSG